jgi:PII-like signaling protein
MEFQQGLLLRAFVGEGDRCEGEPLYKWLIDRAHTEGLAGATVLRGMEGFGADGRVHTSRVMRLSTDLPLVVEMVDSAEKVEAFLELLDGVVDKGVITVERIRFWPAAGNRARSD